jgi:bifunctional DNase/RNase
MGAGLTDVFINELRDGTFYARLSIDSQEIDSRPSDAIALAVRYGVPIFVADKVMDEAAFVPENEGAESQQESQPSKESAPKPKLSKVEQLQNQLAEAIAKEDYEKAARLRDELRKLQGRDS